MNESVSVITGANGLVGSHIAERLCELGKPVRALVRPTSDTSFLKTLPVEIVEVDLKNLQTTPQALENAGTMYHCAAFVRDWGTWQQYEEGTIDLTRKVLAAFRQASVGRFVHVSSISVFGNPPESAGLITEDMPMGKYLWRGDRYGLSKVMAEDIVRDDKNYTILRPSWIYGRRDHVSIPRVIDALRRRRVKLIGSGENKLNLVCARDVARSIVAAGETPQARQQAYNLCSRGEITQREFFELVAEEVGLPRPRRRVPVRLAWRAASIMEAVFRALGRKSPPPFTRRAIYLLSRPIRFDTAKAERDLGWQQEVPAREGLREAIHWLQAVPENEKTPSKSIPA